MNKIKIDPQPFIYPMPMVLVGALVSGKPNFMTVAWVSPANYKPPMIMIALGKSHHTNPGILEHKVFSINIPGQGLIIETDFCGIRSGKQVDKSQVFDVFYGDLKSAPMAKQCALSMECQLLQTVDLPVDTLFIGEVKGVYCEDKYLTEGKPDVKKICPLTLTMPDNNYWGVGENLGKAWSMGKEYKIKEG